MSQDSQLGLEITPKLLELAREMVPTSSNFAVLVNPTNPTIAEPTTRELLVAARVLGVQVHIVYASNEKDFDTVFAMVAQLRSGALVIAADGLFSSRIEQLATLTLRHRVPAIFQDRTFVAAGGLMSYGSSARDSYRLAGLYTGRILKGDKPADLPVQQATKIELRINLKTAKTLGLSIPIALRVRADEVIE